MTRRKPGTGHGHDQENNCEQLETEENGLLKGWAWQRLGLQAVFGFTPGRISLFFSFLWLERRFGGKRSHRQNTPAIKRTIERRCKPRRASGPM